MSDTVIEVINNPTIIEISEVGQQGIPGTGSNEIFGFAGSIISALRVVGFINDFVEHISASILAQRNVACGVSVTAGVVGENIKIATGGVIQDSFWNWDITKPIFCGENGILTQTPSLAGFNLQVGTPITGQKMKVNIQRNITLN